MLSVLLLPACDDGGSTATVQTENTTTNAPNVSEDPVELACRREDDIQQSLLAAEHLAETLKSPESGVTPFRCLRFSDEAAVTSDYAGTSVVNISGEPARASTSSRELRVPLHEIKTKAFLNGRSLVVISDGRQYAALEKECNAIKAAGVSEVIALLPEHAASVGGEVVTPKLTPREFLAERSYGAWHIVNLTSDDLPALLAMADNRRDGRIRATGDEGGTGLERTLIVLDGAQTGEVKKSDNSGEYRGQVFVLDGGLDGLRKFQNEATAMARALARPRINERGCAG